MKNHDKSNINIWKWFLLRSFILDLIVMTMLWIWRIFQIGFNIRIFDVVESYLGGFVGAVLIILMYDSYKESIMNLKKLSLKNRIIVIILFLISLYFVILKLIRDYKKM